jgi:16S rRNA (guanine966-N2)-methyltransferase
MRIIAGRFKGRALASVGKGDTGAHLRPTTDRVRESIFNLLLGGKYDDPISDARVLDLFAGTGALGLEALSRGASHVTFVDDGKKSTALLRQNIALCAEGNETRVIGRDVTKLPSNPAAPFDLIFADPPYGQSLVTTVLPDLLASGWIGPRALIIAEESQPISPPPGFVGLDQRKYGATFITIMEPEST